MTSISMSLLVWLTFLRLSTFFATISNGSMAAVGNLLAGKGHMTVK